MFQQESFRNQLIESAMLLSGDREFSVTTIRTILEAGIRSGEFRANLNIEHAEIFWYGIMNCHANSLLSDVLQWQNETFIIQMVDIYLQGIAKRTFG